mmetsp:Transcript_39913/g.105449  ORF Transcript_39913/g.105449 Transcript_39913/m.105449 type:complete len:162 (+) Transcript_39913:71-556(+)
MARTRHPSDAAFDHEPACAAEHDSQPPPPPVDPLDLVLDREELEMLKIFHRSFKLPGLQFGLLKPVCYEDYYPEDEAHDTPAPDHLQALLKQTAELQLHAGGVLGDDEPLEELMEEEEDVPVFQTSVRPASSGAPVRTVRTTGRPGSGARPPSQGSRPPRR